MQIINPALGTLITKIEADTAQSIKEKHSTLVKALAPWRKTPIRERLKMLEVFQSKLREQVEELSQVLSEETGKTLSEARGEVLGAADKMQFFLDHSLEVTQEKTVRQVGPLQEILSHEPLGVVAHIGAWNYPYLTAMNVLPPALITGNGLLYKPSEHATLTGLKMHELMIQSGVPKEVFQVVVGKGPQGAALLDLPLNGVFFTGSTATGLKIKDKMSIKNPFATVNMELGGKDPLYLTDSIDGSRLEEIAQDVASGLFYNNGQSCCSVERLYVHQKVYEKFMTPLRAIVQNTISQLPKEAPVPEAKMSLGPLTRKEHLSFLQELKEDALQKGASLTALGSLSPSAANEKGGAYFPATLLENVNHRMKLMREETFGPLKGVQKVESDEEAIELMNDTSMGLTASVYGEDRERARHILQQLDTGTRYINCCDRVTSYLPWSGRRSSGIGATLGTVGVSTFLKYTSFHIK